MSAVLDMLALLPQFEPILWLIALAFLALGAGGEAAALHAKARPVRWLLPALGLLALIAGEILWHTAPGAVGEGTRSTAVLICYAALPVLLGALAVMLAGKAKKVQ